MIAPPSLDNGFQRPAAPRRPAPGIDLLQLSVMLMALVSVWRIHSTIPILGAIKLSYLAPAFGILAFIADRAPDRNLRRLGHPLLGKLLGIVLIIALGTPFSLWPGKTADFLFDDHLKTILMFLLLAVSIRSRRDIERYALMHIVGAIIYSFYVTRNFGMRGGRLHSLIYYDSNDFGLLLVCTLPLCVYFLRPAAGIVQRLFAAGALLYLLRVVVLTGSRGAFLGLLACGIFLVLKFDGITRTTRYLAFAGMFAGMMVFGGETYWDMMKSMLNPTDDYNWHGDVGRKQIWQRGMGYMIQRPVLGVGASAFPQAEGQLSPIAVRQQVGQGLKWSAAHNSFVQVGAELGVIGLYLFVSAIVLALRVLLKARDPDHVPIANALAGMLVTYCVAGFFVSAGYSQFLYTVFGMTLGFIYVTRQAAESAPPVPLAAVARQPVRGAVRVVRATPRLAPGAQPARGAGAPALILPD